MTGAIQILTKPLRRTPVGSKGGRQCSRCRGRCCKDCPGTAWPEDFKTPVADSVVAALVSGFWVLEITHDVEAGEVALVPRPAYIKKGKVVSGIVERIPGHAEDKDGQCVLLTDKGCMLPFAYRPYACRHLKPGRGGTGCTQMVGKRKFRILGRDRKRNSFDVWRPYWKKIVHALPIERDPFDIFGPGNGELYRRIRSFMK